MNQSFVCFNFLIGPLFRVHAKGANKGGKNNIGGGTFGGMELLQGQ